MATAQTSQSAHDMRTVADALRWALRRIETSKLGEGDYFERAAAILADADAARQEWWEEPSISPKDCEAYGKACASAALEHAAAQGWERRMSATSAAVEHYAGMAAEASLMRRADVEANERRAEMRKAITRLREADRAAFGSHWGFGDTLSNERYAAEMEVERLIGGMR